MNCKPSRDCVRAVQVAQMNVLVPQNVRLWRIPPCRDYESLCEIQVSREVGEVQKMNYLFWRSLLQMCGALQNYSPTGSEYIYLV